MISGRGSNLQALIDAAKKPDFPGTIVAVISNVTEALGLERAAKASIPTDVISHKNFATREEFDDALHEMITGCKADLICLAGFMRILTPKFIDRWPGRLINIHPSLLPDYKGLHTHRRVLEDKKKETGCTVHYVVPEMDSGPIIVQKRVPVFPDDTEESIGARVLEKEHIAYPEAVRIVAEKLI